MDIVAVVALATSIEEEAAALGRDLRTTVYDAVMLLRAPLPVIVLRSDDRQRTLDVLGGLRSRGHDAVACDLDAVVSSDDMFRPKSFRFDERELVATGGGEEHALRLGEVLALVRASHVTRNEDTVTSSERKLSVGRAALSGGLLSTKTTTTESRRVTTEREPVLYVFHRSGAPWLFASSAIRYDGLGDAMQRSRIDNFELLVERLRERAPASTFDERLLRARPPASVVVASAKRVSTSSSSTIDILAHVVAMSIARSAAPYR